MMFYQASELMLKGRPIGESTAYAALKRCRPLAGCLHVRPEDRHWKIGTLERNVSRRSKYGVSRWDALRARFLLPSSLIFCVASIKGTSTAPGKEKRWFCPKASLSHLPLLHEMLYCGVSPHYTWHCSRTKTTS